MRVHREFRDDGLLAIEVYIADDSSIKAVRVWDEHGKEIAVNRIDCLDCKAAPNGYCAICRGVGVLLNG